MRAVTTPPARTSTRRLIVSLALIALAAGYGTFGSTAALGDVAKAFGIHSDQSTFSARLGLTWTTLGIGIGVLRAASLLALPLAALADRAGRRRVLFACGVVGLCVTASAALCPGFWWFVALFALARPALSAASTLTGVMTAELTSAKSRATALAVVTAGAAGGAGLSAVVHGAVRGHDAFRILFGTAILAAGLVALLVGRLPETTTAEAEAAASPRLGGFPRELRGRLAIVMAVTAAAGAISGPASGLAFVYAENYLKIHPATVSTVVVLSAIPGVLGLVLGRRLADVAGRRAAVAVGVLGAAGTSLLAYSGGAPAFICGYVIGVFAGGLFAPGAAALATEPFPTSVRASAGGWIVVAAVLGGLVGILVFCVVADAANSTLVAGLAAFLPGLPVLFALRRLPETKGLALT